MNWFDRFCSRFDGIAARLEDWLRDGPEINEEKEKTGGPSAVETRNAKIYEEAVRIRNRSRQAEDVRENAIIILAGGWTERLNLIDTCIETSITNARSLRDRLVSGELDPYLLLNAVEGKTLTAAKSDDTDDIVIRRLLSMRLAIVTETLLGKLDACVKEEIRGTQGDFAELKRNVLRQLKELDSEFDTARLLREAVDAARAIVGTLPEEMKPTKGNVRSGKPVAR